MGLVDSAIVRFLPAVPKPLVRRISSRYIAGEDLDAALRVVRRLNDEGKLATIDVLGEEVAGPEEAHAIATAYRDAIDAFERGHLESNVSVKLTGLGLKLGYELCRENLESVVQHAADHGNFVRIDMEDSSTTDDTLRLYRELRESGHENVGIVLQARLKRTLQDIRELADQSPNVRLCKGIYLEPPSIAFQEFEAIRASFVACLDALLAAGARTAIATHDEWLLQRALERVAGIDRNAFELQMLLGVRGDRARELVAAAYPLRVYVPYGRQWYEYSLRRLQENPKVAGYVARDVVGRVFRR